MRNRWTSKSKHIILYFLSTYFFNDNQYVQEKKLQDNERPLYTQLTSYSAILFFLFIEVRAARDKQIREREGDTNERLLYKIQHWESLDVVHTLIQYIKAD